MEEENALEQPEESTRQALPEPPITPRPSKRRRMMLATVGGAVGGILGAVAFVLVVRQGYYMLPLVGVAVALGRNALWTGWSRRLGLVCGLFGLVISLGLDWHYFSAYKLHYYLYTLPRQDWLTLASLAASAGIAYWFGVGTREITYEDLLE